MVPELDLWSPEQELRLLEELAETESRDFDMDLGLAMSVVAPEPERAWVAYWQLPTDGSRVRPRAGARQVRGR